MNCGERAFLGEVEEKREWEVRKWESWKDGKIGSAVL